MDLTRPFIYRAARQSILMVALGLLLAAVAGCATGTPVIGATATSLMIVPQNQAGAANPEVTLVQPRDRQLPQQQQQDQPTPTPTTTPVGVSQVTVGSTVEIDTKAGAIQVNFTIDKAQFVNILARSVDGVTNPVMFMYAAGERLIAYSDDHISKRTDLNMVDAMIEDAYLIPGTYSVRVESRDGDGRITVGLETASGGVLGIGQQTILRASLQPGQRFLQRLNLNANEVISISVISESATFDPRIRLETPDGQPVAKNDDADSFDIVLNSTDAKIENLIVPVAGEYVVEIRGFSNNDVGTFQLIIARYGTLEPVDPPVVELTGEILHRQRLEFPLELNAGEFVTVTARADNSQIDPGVALLDPDNIILFSNDDHNTNATDIGQYDARVSNFLIQTTGTFSLNLESVSGRGNYKITVQRFGKLNPEVIGTPVDTSANEVVNLPPTAIPQTPVPPEATGEATPGQ